MRNVILYIAMSLDGFIADANGGVAWLSGDGTEPDNPGSYPEFIESIDTVILGYKTYHQIVTELSPGKWFYEGKTSYVLTHQNKKSTDEIIFTDQAPSELIRELKQKDGKDIWICGGASLVNQIICDHLIDRYHVTIIPAILGDGVRLFEKNHVEEKLQLIDAKSNNGMTDLVYKQRK